MARTSRRVSAMTYRSDHDRQSIGGDGKKDIWLSMLDEVSSGKRLPEKNLLILGGTPESQIEFLESLSHDPTSRRRPLDRSRDPMPPIANRFALGYTYQDVIDADQEDTLARLSLYLLSDPSPSFAPLLKPLLTPRSLPNMLVVILLDWSRPWSWLRQLQEWMRTLRTLVVSLDDECKEVIEANIIHRRERGRSGAADGIQSTADASIAIPLGSGEWDEPLGVPLCVVCQNADKIESLERERGWKEEKFDFVLQYMRTVLLKHGASLIYTMPSAPGSLQTLIYSALDIELSPERKSLKHNVIDRDRVLVPPNWDSWGKIRVLREGFDVEGVSKAWSMEIQPTRATEISEGVTDGEQNDPVVYAHGVDSKDKEGSAVAIYEDTIRDPDRDSSLAQALRLKNPGIEVETMDNQKFLAEQLERLESYRAEDEAEKKGREARRAASGSSSLYSGLVEESGRTVHDYIGPVHFNIGGIQVDADDELKRLKDRAARRTPELEATPTSPGQMDNEKLASFFAGLMKKTGGSASNSPRS
ncbi:dynein [Cryomyces antarcticus]